MRVCFGLRVDPLVERRVGRRSVRMYVCMNVCSDMVFEVYIRHITRQRHMYLSKSSLKIRYMPVTWDMYVCVYGCMYVCMCVCVYVCMCVCMCVCMYVCMYVCVY